MSEKLKILMMSKPGGDRGPATGYKNHMNALSFSNKFIIKELENVKNDNELNEFDYFWFYTRFDPRFYFHIKENFPTKKIICGPNVIFENARSVPFDEWEKWFISVAEPDLSINVAEYYVEYVKEYYTKAKNYMTLEYVANTVSSFDLVQSKENDFLIYRKKRRYDTHHDFIFSNLIEKLSNHDNISFKTIVYGDHTREEYIKLVKQSKFVVWTSIDDYCSLAQLECLSAGVPLIGTKYNCTVLHDSNFIVNNVASISRDYFVEWNDLKDVVDGFYNKIVEMSNVSEKEYKIIVNELRLNFSKYYSSDAYTTNVENILSCL